MTDRQVDGDVASIPYVVAELLRELLREAGDDVTAQARAIATNNAGRTTA